MTSQRGHDGHSQGYSVMFRDHLFPRYEYSKQVLNVRARYLSSWCVQGGRSADPNEFTNNRITTVSAAMVGATTDTMYKY